jgi:hypothetical protein
VVWNTTAYHAPVLRLFKQDANMHNVKAYSSVRRAKFDTHIAGSAPATGPANGR